MLKIILPFNIIFCLSVLLYLVFIPIFKKVKCNQQILSYVAEHKTKKGTPTMGGLIFVLLAIVYALIFCKRDTNLVIFCIAITFSYMVVGFLDDLLKVKNSQNLGLKAYQKIIFQLSIAIVVGLFCYKNSLTLLYIPFTTKTVNVKMFIVPLVIIVFLATTNTVNLTDGLDGLAGSTSVIYLIFLSVLTYLQIKNNAEIYLLNNEFYNLIYLNILFAGAILGFLVFNTNKASIFMGDTGSLALGGLVGCSSIFTGNMLYIPIMGVCYVISGLSVIIQVVYFKITKGKRVFLMAPIHHHFQKKGFAESKIVFCYVAITIVFGVISLLNFL